MASPIPRHSVICDRLQSHTASDQKIQLIKPSRSCNNFSGGENCVTFRPVGMGFQGGSLESHFWPEKILYTTQLYILSDLPFVSGPLVFLPLRITTVQTSLVAAMHLVCSWRTSAELRISGLRRCDERTSVIRAEINRYFQALESSQVIHLSPPPMKWHLNWLESNHASESAWKRIHAVLPSTFLS